MHIALPACTSPALLPGKRLLCFVSGVVRVFVFAHILGCAVPVVHARVWLCGFVCIGIACLQFQGDIIVSGSSDKTLRKWSIGQGKSLATLNGHEDLVRCVRFSRTHIVSGSYDQTVRVWDFETGTLVDVTLVAGACDTRMCLGVCAPLSLHSNTCEPGRLNLSFLNVVSSRSTVMNTNHAYGLSGTSCTQRFWITF